MADKSCPTSITLLGRLKSEPSDQIAWATFVERYGPIINGWCRMRGLQEADAEDVTQNVMVRLARALKTFDYDPSKTFRGWLRHITENAISDFFADRKRRPVAGSGQNQVLDILASVQARDELMALLDQQFADALMTEVCAVVQTKVEARTWEAFRLTACEGRTGDETAMQLGMTNTAVFKAKSRVISLLRKEVARLADE